MRLPVGEVLTVAAAVAGAGPDELMGRAAEAPGRTSPAGAAGLPAGRPP